ncbi:MAG: AAA family ATPase [Candidatus Levybacteria bacterium]|nr:AAA family ATPase [Candidatus Levybacteria bacterium]MBI3070142.1 AAA family ATPase [Candidatus Levybacteria bacterium]MBI3092837.1 AAA family ATPase [Candidatus Levybacteria bacterium]
MKSNYYITGISGTGKSAIASELRKDNIQAYDIDEIKGICHWRHKESGEKAIYYTGIGREWLDAHEWICDEEKLKELLDKHSHSDVVVVGIASNQENYLKYFDKFFLLYCGKETFLKRLNTRNEGNAFGKDKSEQEQILSWYKDFENRMIKLGAMPINTERKLEDIVREIKANMTIEK